MHTQGAVARCCRRQALLNGAGCAAQGSNFHIVWTSTFPKAIPNVNISIKTPGFHVDRMALIGHKVRRIQDKVKKKKAGGLMPWDFSIYYMCAVTGTMQSCFSITIGSVGSDRGESMHGKLTV